MSEKQIAYLPCPIISNEIKAQINDLGYIPVDDAFQPDGYQLPPELQSIKQAIDEQNAETLNKAVAFNQALEELADSKRPASKQWVRDYVSEHGGGGTPPDYNQVKEQVAKNTANIQKLADYTGADLNIEYIPLQDNQGVKLVSSTIKAIDTGLTMNGNLLFKVKGCTTLDSQAVLIGAYQSSTTRTSLKILGRSKKIQSQWAGNQEITQVDTKGLDLFTPFEYVQDKNTTTITQGNTVLSCVNSGYSGTDANTAVYLFNQTTTDEMNNGVLCYAIAYDDTTMSEWRFIPKIKRNILTGDSVIVLTKNGKEMPLPNGCSLEVVTFQAA